MYSNPAVLPLHSMYPYSNNLAPFILTFKSEEVPILMETSCLLGASICRPAACINDSSTFGLVRQRPIWRAQHNKHPTPHTFPCHFTAIHLIQCHCKIIRSAYKTSGRLMLSRTTCSERFVVLYQIVSGRSAQCSPEMQYHYYSAGPCSCLLEAAKRLLHHDAHS